MAKSGGPVGIRFLGAIRRKMVAVSLVSRQASGHFSMIGDFAISIKALEDPAHRGLGGGFANLRGDVWPV